MEIVCTAGREQGTLIAPSQTLAVQLQVKDCTTEVRDGGLTAHAKVVAKGALALFYEASGGVQPGISSSITFDIKALSCELTLSAPLKLNFPGPTEYGNENVPTTRLGKFPSGFQHKLKLSGELVLDESQTTPGSCPEIETLGKAPKGASGGELTAPIYRGTTFDEVKGADLGLEEEETLPGGWNRVTNVPE
jgi:hypothetical protein